MLEQPIQYLEERLNYHFKQPELLLEALSHPSYCAEHTTSIQSNQRLEFLGDAVLDLLVGDWLYHQFPNWDEGLLTRARASLTRTETLALFARELELGKYLRLGHGEEAGGGRERDSSLCDALEAIIGALYLDTDRNLQKVWDTIGFFFEAYRESLGHRLFFDNPKGLLQEISQNLFHERPIYNLEEVSGPEHQRIFTCSVRIQGKVIAIGKGNRIRNAEQEAASAALEALSNQYGLEIIPEPYRQ